MQIDAGLGVPLLPQAPEVLLHLSVHLVRQDDLVVDVQVAELVLVVDAVAVLVVLGHALAGDGVDVPVLDDLAALAAEADNVRVEVRQVAAPGAHPGLAEGEDFGPVEVVALAAEEDAVDLVRVVFLGGGPFGEGDDEVAGDPVGTLVCLVLVDNL